MRIDNKFKLEYMVDKDVTNPAMQQVLIENGKAIATDGHKMIVAQIISQPDENGLLSIESLKEARRLKTLGESIITFDENKESLVNGASRTRLQRTYPQWQSAIPTVPPILVIGIDARRLYDLAQAMGEQELVLEIIAPNKAIRVYPNKVDYTPRVPNENSTENNRSFGLIMPMLTIPNYKCGFDETVFVKPVEEPVEEPLTEPKEALANA